MVLNVDIVKIGKLTRGDYAREYRVFVLKFRENGNEYYRVKYVINDDRQYWIRGKYKKASTAKKHFDDFIKSIMKDNDLYKKRKNEKFVYRLKIEMDKL